MIERLNVVDVHIARAVAQNVVLGDLLVVVAFGKLGRRPQGYHVGSQRPWGVIEHVARVERHVLRMRDDHRSDVHIGSESADVIVMLVRVHEESNGFVGDTFHDLFDYGEVPGLIDGRFDNGDEILELDSDTVVRRSPQ